MGFDRGKIEIEEITGGVVNFDGAVIISPKTTSKTANGAGSSNTALVSFTFSGTNFTNTHTVDFIDQPINDTN